MAGKKRVLYRLEDVISSVQDPDLSGLPFSVFCQSSGKQKREV